jgi:CheY-like chemotaxis protein
VPTDSARSGPGARPKVLVVDDSAVDRRLAGGLLAKRGFVPAYASNGVEALAALATDLPDLVVTDLQMPELDGLSLVESIRKLHPFVPVLLMTAHGSEEIAARALKSGAASYVPKRSLARELAPIALGLLEVARARRHEQQVLACLTENEAHFELENDIGSIAPLVGHLEQGLTRMGICDETGLIQVQVALREALVNAIVHGNLEVRSDLKETDEASYHELCALRQNEAPYRGRRVRVVARETREEAVYVIGDEGPGFDPTSLPDPMDPNNLERSTGRGLLLIRTFMDEVRHNATGNEITMVKRRDAAATGTAASGPPRSDRPADR